MSPKRAYLKNLTFSYSPFLVHIGVTILVTPYAVHRLGGFEYGILVLFNTLLGYLALANVGTPQTIMRRLIKYDSEGSAEKTSGLVSTLFVTYSALILVGGVAVWLLLERNIFDLAAQIIKDSQALALLRQVSLWLFLVFAFDLWRILFDSMIVAKNKIYLSKILLAVLMLARGVALYLVLKGGGSLYGVLLAYAVLAIVFSAAYAVVALREQRVMLSLKLFNLHYLTDVIPDSFWYFLGGVAVVLIFQTDSLVISALIGVSAITTYALMFRYVDVVGRMMTNVVMVLYPQVAQMYEDSRLNSLLHLHDRITLSLIPAALVVFGLFYLVGSKIFGLWMGNLDLFDQRLFLVFLAINVLSLISAPATNFIEAVGWHRFSTKLSLAQGALNLILSILLAKQYGLQGVALGTLIALACTNFPGNIIYFRRRLKTAIKGD